MNQLPTVRQLRYFVALERSGHFGRAAEACFVSQSAFSVAIRELETVLDVQLVDRTTKRVAITPIGREIAAQARLALRDIEQLMEMAGRARQPLTGRLTLGAIPTIAPFLLPKALPYIRKRHPDLQVFIREDRTADLCDGLVDGSLDAILLALPYPLRNVEVESLFRDRFLLACHKNTQLVDPEKFSVNRVTANSVILLEDGHCLRDHALAACKVRNLDVVNRFAATSLLTLIEMVDADLGVTFIPEMAAGSSLLKQTNVKTWPMARNNYRDIALAWRKSSARSDEFRMLADLIRAAATPN
ncbi:MAG: hydrogen peroxide-inducible genes activator [Gammaproteobacteria bacterium]|nr:hydrogen peroxide-inducible genes activator [Gammaproteobacteria bacterium]